MIIKSIKIDGFGKHKNLDIIFSEGLNIVYGSNEVGKSTLQAFIKAMFYGLNSRTRSISDNPRKKYTPWDSDDMGGEIIFLNNGLEYSLVRKFGDVRSKDKIILSIAASGDIVPVNVKEEPGEFLFNITQATFESTLFVSQLDSKIDSSSAKESDILAKLSNIAGTGDENTDINSIENNLNKPMLYLHSARGQNGYIDKLKNRLSELKEEFSEFESAKSTSLKIINDLNVYIARRDSILDEISRYKHQLKAATSQNALTEFEKLKEIKERKISQEKYLEEIKDCLTVNGIYIDRVYYEKCISDFKEVEDATEELSAPAQILGNAKETVSLIDGRMSNLEHLNHFNIDAFEDVNELKNELSRAIERKKTLDLELTDAMIALENKQALCKTNPRSIFLWAGCLVIIAVLCITGGVIFSSNAFVSYILFGTAGAISLFAFIFNLLKRQKSRDNKINLIYANAEVERLNKQLDSIRTDISAFISGKDSDSQNKFKEILGDTVISANELEQKYILLSKYITSTFTSINCDSTQHIREKLSLYKSYKLQREDAMKTVTSLTEVYNQKERISCDVTSGFYSKYADIFSLSSIEDIKESLQNIFHYLNKHDSVIMDLKYSSDYLKNALSGRSYDELEKAAEIAIRDGLGTYDDLPADPDVIKTRLEELDKDLNIIKDAISDTNIRIAANFKSFRDENEILSDIDDLSMAIDDLEHQYDCMKLAKTVLKDSFNEIQQSFGPKLNDRASEILNSIKPDNPMEIKVNRDFNITLSPKDSSLPYEIDYFSYGAQDQAYFALRMAISDILSADFEGFPLLLDDPFVQYDEKRMHATLDFLSDVARSRQVFIFTCHKDVSEYSSGLGSNCFELK